MKPIAFIVPSMLLSICLAGACSGDSDDNSTDVEDTTDIDTETSNGTDTSDTTSDTDTNGTDTDNSTDTESTPDTPTPVERHGHLRTSGSQIVGDHGDPVMLKGMSLYWSVWGPQKYYNEHVVKWLVTDWKASLIRAAMAVDINQTGANRGWLYHQDHQTALVETVVDAAIENGIYVIVDWHTHSIHTDDAKEFFGYMARKYGNTPNVIWEIFNEPERQTWADIRAYSQEVIDVIREHSDNLVIAGTRTWSQRVDEASENPIDDPNTAYALHFYAGTHGQDLRNRAQTALDNGVAVFISEWGTSTADGGRNDPTAYLDESTVWIRWAQDRHISMANWSLGDIAETSAALVPGAPVHGDWDPDTHLTESGRFVRDQILDLHTRQ